MDAFPLNFGAVRDAAFLAFLEFSKSLPFALVPVEDTALQLHLARAGFGQALWNFDPATFSFYTFYTGNAIANHLLSFFAARGQLVIGQDIFSFSLENYKASRPTISVSKNGTKLATVSAMIDFSAEINPSGFLGNVQIISGSEKFTVRVPSIEYLAANAVLNDKDSDFMDKAVPIFRAFNSAGAFDYQKLSRALGAKNKSRAPGFIKKISSC